MRQTNHSIIVEDDVPYMGSAIFMHRYGRLEKSFSVQKNRQQKPSVCDILLVKIFEIFSDKLASLLYAVNRTQWV